MSAKTKAAKVLGRIARQLPYLRFILHGIGIPSTLMGLYFLAEDPVSAMGVPLVLFGAICFVIAVLLQGSIAILESVISSFLVRLLPRPGVPATVLFSLCFVLFLGLGWGVHQVSQEGRIGAVDKLIEDPTKAAPTLVDSTRNVAFATAGEVFERDKKEAREALKAAKAAAKAQAWNVTVRIGPGDHRTISGALAKAKSVEGPSPSWAAGIRANVKKAQDQARANEAALVAEAEKAYQERLTVLLAVREAAEQKAEGQHTLDLAEHNRREEARISTLVHVKGLVNSSGYWLVIFSTFGPLLVSICCQLYFKIAEIEPDGEIYDPTKNKSKAFNQLRGWFDDQFEVIDRRFGQYRTESKQRKLQRGAYRFAWSENFGTAVLSIVTVVVFIKSAPVLRDMLSGEPGLQQMGFAGDPIYWLGAVAIGWAFRLRHNISFQIGKKVSAAEKSAPFLSESQTDFTSENSLSSGFQGGKSDSDLLKNTPEKEDSALKSQSISVPPAGVATPPKVRGSFKVDDEVIKYRKRVYSWWQTANNKKKDKPIRDENRAKAEAAFKWFESHGCTVTIKPAGKVSIKFPKA